MGNQAYRGDSIEPRLGTGIRVHRCQTVSESINLNDEDALELGNKGIVETMYDAPEASLTLECNEVGVTRELALATNLSFGCLVSATGLSAFNINQGIYHSLGATWELESKLTGLGIAAASATSRIDVVSLKKQDTMPQYTLTGGVEGGSPVAPSTPANEVKIAEITVDTAGITTVTDSRATAFTTITQNSFDGAVTDYQSIIQDPSTYDPDTGLADVVAAEFLADLYPTRWSGTYEVSGFARETIELVGDKPYMLTGTAKHLQCDKSVSAGGTTVTLSQTPVALTSWTATVRKTLKVTVNGTLCDEIAAPATATEFSVSGTTVTFGAALTSGDVVVVWYGCVLAGGQTFKALNTTYKGGMKRANCVLSIYDGSTDTTLDRVQSISFECPIERAANFQLGDLEAFNRSMQFPVKITGSLSVLHSDLNIFHQLVAKVAANENSLRAQDYQRDKNTTTVGLKVRLYDDADHTNLLKTILVPEIMITGPTPVSKNVGADSTSQFGFRGDTITITNNYY